MDLFRHGQPRGLQHLGLQVPRMPSAASQYSVRVPQGVPDMPFSLEQLATDTNFHVIW